MATGTGSKAMRPSTSGRKTNSQIGTTQKTPTVKSLPTPGTFQHSKSPRYIKSACSEARGGTTTISTVPTHNFCTAPIPPSPLSSHYNSAVSQEHADSNLVTLAGGTNNRIETNLLVTRSIYAHSPLTLNDVVAAAEGMPRGIFNNFAPREIAPIIKYIRLKNSRAVHHRHDAY